MYIDVETSNWIERRMKPRVSIQLWNQMTGSPRLHDLIRICQHTIPNLAKIRWNRRLSCSGESPRHELYSEVDPVSDVASYLQISTSGRATLSSPIEYLRIPRTMLPPPGSVKSSQLCGDANYSRVRGEERPITTLLEPTSGLSLSLSLPPLYRPKNVESSRIFEIGKRSIACTTLL